MTKGKNKKGIGSKKDEIGRKIITKFIGFSAKTYSNLMDGSSEDKKVKGTQKGVIKRIHK